MLYKTIVFFILWTLVILMTERKCKKTFFSKLIRISFSTKKQETKKLTKDGMLINVTRFAMRGFSMEKKSKSNFLVYFDVEFQEAGHKATN